MAETVQNLRLFLIYLISEAAEENGVGVLTMCLTALTILTVEADLYRIRLGILYPAEDFIRLDHTTTSGFSMKTFLSKVQVQVERLSSIYQSNWI